MQYMDRIDILKWFIMFERTGNWVMHFQAMTEMLPLMLMMDDYLSNIF